jgi:hypothetical protein
VEGRRWRDTFTRLKPAADLVRKEKTTHEKKSHVSIRLL